MKPNIFRVLEVLIIGAVMCVLFATIAKAEDPNPVKGYDGWWIYKTSTAGYDALMSYKYKRTIFVAVGPPESVYPDQPPPEVYIRYAILGVKEIVAVRDEDEICNPDAPVYIEYGDELFHECPPWEPHP